MSKKILITGATGSIGSKLSKELIKRGDTVSVFTRNVDKTKKIIPGAFEYLTWDFEKPEQWEKHLFDKDAIIHLAGANLFSKRWNKNYKKVIWNSRVLSTKNIVESIKKNNSSAPVFICASAVGFYGDSGKKILTEQRQNGNDFLAKLTAAWEDEASKATEFGIRTISVRTGIVLTKEDGMLKEMLLPFKFFIGGPLGSGKQWVPWIHIDDIIKIYLFALDNSNLNGAVNASSPNPVTMNDFAETLGKILHRPAFFKVPKFALKIVVGEIAETILASLKVIPQKLLENDFKFKFEKLENALKDLLANEYC